MEETEEMEEMEDMEDMVEIEELEEREGCSWHCFCGPMLAERDHLERITISVAVTRDNEDVQISTTPTPPSLSTSVQDLSEGRGNNKTKRKGLPRHFLLSPTKRQRTKDLPVSPTGSLSVTVESPLKADVDVITSLNQETLEPPVGTSEGQGHPVETDISEPDAVPLICNPLTVVTASTNESTLEIKAKNDIKDASAREEEADNYNGIISSKNSEECGNDETECNSELEMDVDVDKKKEQKDEMLKEPIALSTNAQSSSLSSAPSNVYNCRNMSQYHKCGTCGKMFRQLRTLKMHEKEHLLESSKHWECVECGKSYSTLASYQRHLKSHTKCLLCGNGISKSQKERLAAGGGLDVNVCSRCKKKDLHSPRKRKSDAISFETEGNHSNSESNEFDESSSSGTDEEDNEEDNSSLLEEEHKCDVCGQHFALLSKLNQHKSLHRISELIYICRYCGEGFPTSALMKKHDGIVHSAERPYKCPFCPDRFKEKHHRARHELTHTGDNSHSCQRCPASFNQEFRLIHHIAKYHPASDDDVN